MKKETNILDGIPVTNVIYEESDFRNETEKQLVLNVCFSCDKYKDDFCQECGCIIQNIIGPKNQNCPIGKW